MPFSRFGVAAMFANRATMFAVDGQVARMELRDPNVIVQYVACDCGDCWMRKMLGVFGHPDDVIGWLWRTSSLPHLPEFDGIWPGFVQKVLWTASLFKALTDAVDVPTDPLADFHRFFTD